MDIQKTLEEIGLTKNEAKVYLALIELGESTTAPIIKKTGINTSKVYESLDRLIGKGLVSYIIVKNKKNYNALDPSQLVTFLEHKIAQIKEQEKTIHEIIPILKEKQSTKKQKTQYSVLEGLRGIKASREKALEKMKRGDTLHIILSSFPKEDTLEGYWIDFQKRRAKKGVKCEYIFNKSFRDLAKERGKIPLTKIRYTNSEILTYTWIEIYGETVGIGILNENPSIFLIENQEIAKGFLEYFKSLWKKAQP